MRYLVLISVLLCQSLVILGQNDFSGGLLPKVNLSFKLADQWKLNSSLEQRQQLFDVDEQAIEYVLLDFANAISYKMRNGQSLNFAYTLRNRNKEFHHRFTQQFSKVNEYAFFRLGQRFGMDQTIIPDEPLIFRMRYRLSFERALQGSVIDEKEFYLKINNEYLGITDGTKHDVELRLIPFIGYEFNKTNKLEVGLDGRLATFLNTEEVSEKRLWLSIIWYRSL